MSRASVKEKGSILTEGTRPKGGLGIGLTKALQRGVVAHSESE